MQAKLICIALIVTLHNIIEKIDSEEDVSNLLVALATCSGKTYVQALWILVMYLRDNNAIFALPDKLITQFQNDLRRFLPDALVDELLQLLNNKECPEAVSALNDFNQSSAKPHIILSAGERLLDEHYQQLLAMDPDKTF
ncbi:MAG: DEAD/DEAH box helicase family protein [Legionella sp.]